MKKITKLLIIALLVLAMFPLEGCSMAIQTVGNGFFREWGATEEGVLHDVYALMDPNAPGQSTGGYDSGNGTWTAQWIYTAKRSTVLCEVDNIEVKKGFYSFQVNMSIGGVDVAFSGYRHDVIAELRVQESKTGKNIAFRSVLMEEYEVMDTFQDVSIEFYVAENTEIDIFVCAKNNIKNTVKTLSIRSISSSDYHIPDYEYLLQEKTSSDKALVYDDDVLYLFHAWDYIKSLTDTTVAYDIISMVVAMQGIVNRDGPHLYINFVESNSQYSGASFNGDLDMYWLNELTAPGGELEGKTVVTVDSFMTLYRLFSNKLNGLAVWDEDVPATYNVANTCAGVSNVLPVRYDAEYGSLYYVMTKKFGVPVIYNFEGKFTGNGTIWGTNTVSTGSSKCDAYIWAKETFLDAGKTNPLLMANHLDAATMDITWAEGEQVSMYDNLQQCWLANKDYYIQNKAFFWDLNCYDFFAPGDDLDQPLGTDYKTLCSILEKQNELAGNEIIEIGGFVAWYYPKYTDAYGINQTFPDAISAEWRWSEVFGYYNAITHADAYGANGVGPMANASVYSQIPELDSYEQTGDSARWFNANTMSLEDVDLTLRNYNYVCIYMGDFDSAAWMYSYLPRMYFEDPRRGQMPLCWPIVTNNVHRVPFIINRMYRTATANDYFTAGDNGYGYSHAGSYISEKRPLKSDGEPLNGTLETYFMKNLEEMQKFDIDFHSFFLSTEGSVPEVERQWAKICTAGIFSNYYRTGVEIENLIDIYGTPDNYDDDVPFQTLIGLSTSPSSSATVKFGFINSLKNNPSSPTFTSYRAIATTPTLIYEALRDMELYNIRIVDPYTYMKLFKEYTVMNLV